MEQVSGKQMVNMRYPKVLLNNIDEYQNRKGFNTRTQTIIHLIQLGLDVQAKKAGKKG